LTTDDILHISAIFVSSRPERSGAEKSLPLFDKKLFAPFGTIILSFRPESST